MLGRRRLLTRAELARPVAAGPAPDGSQLLRIPITF